MAGKHVAGTWVLQKSRMCQYSIEGVVGFISIMFINLGLTWVHSFCCLLSAIARLSGRAKYRDFPVGLNLVFHLSPGTELQFDWREVLICESMSLLSWFF